MRDVITTAILLERNYKGTYERYALTPAEFAEEYPDLWKELGNSVPEECGSYTISPLVHIWFCPTEIFSDKWRRFFSDMTYGLSKSDIESGNVAYTSSKMARSLQQIIETYE